MSDTKVLDTSKETLAEQHLPTTTHIPNICQPGDKECIARLVQAFSDCD
jgi:hypothetical protein